MDDRSFAAFAKLDPERARQHIVRVRDVTGISDDEKIKRALDRAREPAGGFNLNRAIDLLMSASNGTSTDPRLLTVKEEEMAPSPATPALLMSPAVMQPSPRPVVDLTEESKPAGGDDLQRAIELSLAEGGVTVGNSSFSQEEQDVSKALEASLLESTRSRRKTDSQNPHDKKRDGEWPVGLKNVGQTCWFSAVIQSLFHLPAFRHLVLNFQPVQKRERTENQRVIEFMLELRKLFALLVGSQRSYVDPSRAVGILRDTMGGEGQFTNSQQDVSEFTHNLLDWLEEAFKITDKTDAGFYKASESDPDTMDAESEKCDKEKEAAEDKENNEENNFEIPDKPAFTSSGINPMKDLFYGLVKIEGRNQGNMFTKEEPFGQWPLQVNNFSDIHESLNASTAHENIDTSSQSDLASASGSQPTSLRNSGQERWFTKLPPVLFFELCRFKFNQQRCVAEKVNNFLDFPETIYLDRYLEVNKNITRSKREEVKSLQERHETLGCRLKAYQQYGSSEPKLPLVSVLQCVLEFTRAGRVVGEAESPNNCAMQVDSPCPSPASLTPSTSLTNLTSVGKTAEKATSLKTLPDGSIIIPIRVEGPEPTPMEVETSHPAGQDLEIPEGLAPRHLSELELKVISAALTRWRKEVEEDIAALSKALQDIEHEISMMYEDPSLKQNPYKLHAVMVHEGDANQGHYWAYVYHTGRTVWLKFNDNTVSETTWEAMKKESTGSRVNTSAYSLVYIDGSRADLSHVSGTKSLDSGATRDALPEDLEAFLLEDNKLFAAEIINWDREQERKKKGAADDECQDGVLIGDDPECQIIEFKDDLSSSHGLLAQEITRRALAKVSPRLICDKRKPGYAANILVKEICHMVEAEAKLGGETEEPRLLSFLHYLAVIRVRDEVFRRALLEQVAFAGLQNVSEAGRLVSQEARDLLAGEVTPGVLEESNRWHRAYHNFRIAYHYFFLGVESFQEKMFAESVDQLTVAYIVSQRLQEDPPLVSNPKLKAISEGILMKPFYSAVESLNLRYVDDFESAENSAEINQVSQSVSRLLVPAIQILQTRTNQLGGAGRDARLLEEVRSRWCTLLETQMTKPKNDYWTAIFNTVVSDETPTTLRQPPNLRYPKLTDDLDLAQKFSRVFFVGQQK